HVHVYVHEAGICTAIRCKTAYALGAPARPASRALGVRALERLHERVARMRARHAEPTAQHEERHAADAERACLGLVGTDLARVRVGGERAIELRAIEPGLYGRGGERRGIAERDAVGEMGAEQALDHRRLHATLVRQLDHAVRVEGVAAARAFELVRDADLGA